jgi:arylsulfatase
VRPRIPPYLLALLLPLALTCRPNPVERELAWERVDLWLTRPEVEAGPAGAARPFSPKISYLGAEEVRDLRLVPAAQLVAFPKRTAGQVRALEVAAGSLLKWRVRVGEEGYFSFIPLGSERPCPCVYRAGVRDEEGKIHLLAEVESAPMGPTAPAAVEVDLSPWAGREVELLIQLDGPAEAAPGEPRPTALWGSPALYGRSAGPDAGQTAREAAPERPNVVLLGMDTLRADALGAWGRRPSLTPAMDRLAAESDVWLDAYSAFNVTNPSFVSLFTGLWGKNHGVYDLQTPLPASFTTLAEHLRAAGYETLGIISARHLGDHNSGLGQGFDEVTRADEHFSGELAVDMAMDWIGARGSGDRPFFAWVHLFDPHTPHTPPAPYSLGFRPAAERALAPVGEWTTFRSPGPRGFVDPILGGHKELYDGEVAYLDRQVGRLLGFLRSRGLLEDTVVALVADHGESLGEHGIRFRHVGLHDTTTHVPLMIRWPGRDGREQGRRIEGLVQTIDLFPTLLRAAGLPIPESDGRDLAELTAEGRTGRRAVFAEHSGRTGLMARTPEWKLILSEGNPQFFPDGPYLYDLGADPGETENLAGRGLPQEKELNDLLRRWLADRRPGPDVRPRDLSPEDVERLRALGYL